MYCKVVLVSAGLLKLTDRPKAQLAIAHSPFQVFKDCKAARHTQQEALNGVVNESQQLHLTSS
jgi:hypothetical protein